MFLYTVCSYLQIISPRTKGIPSSGKHCRIVTKNQSGIQFQFSLFIPVQNPGIFMAFWLPLQKRALYTAVDRGQEGQTVELRCIRGNYCQKEKRSQDNRAKLGNNKTIYKDSKMRWNFCPYIKRNVGFLPKQSAEIRKCFHSLKIMLFLVNSMSLTVNWI